MKWIFFLFLFACTSAPSVKRLTSQQIIQHEECLKPIENLRTPGEFQNTLLQTTKTTGSLLLTSFGVASDTVFITPGLAGTIYLCGHSAGNGCGEIFGGYIGLMEQINLLWTSKRIYNGTESWRCPEVDHISKAFREVSTCLHENGELVSAFAQLNQLMLDKTITNCASQTEMQRIERLLDLLMRTNPVSDTEI